MSALKTFQFTAPATETLQGTAFFEVEAATEAEARKLLAANSADYFTDFSETDGGTEWEANKPDDFKAI